ncbi:MAG TPA: UDP-N-acetylglucosamine 2-epimerase (non-hydrolyzing) [Blastocatellia bacterium]|nr:UDP-N-acetylglucosamine 2-epimerase (non-hydrolyzing) [Blastocatellia bacterium]
MSENLNRSQQVLRSFRRATGLGRPAAAPNEKRANTILALFGTRPEVIKLAPVINAIERREFGIRSLNVASGQHNDLLYPFINQFGIRMDYDLRIMEPNQNPNQVCSRLLERLDPILDVERPDMILVQGDTTTAMAGALAGFHRRIPVAHVEAGLRSGNPESPYPEEVNRQLISRLATHHFAATVRNRETLISEGVRPETIFVTGNPIVDSLTKMIDGLTPSPDLAELLDSTAGLKRLVLTTHRRESFGSVMTDNLAVLRKFVEMHRDVVLLFPVHPNPAVRGPATEILSGRPRIHLLQPLHYQQFVLLLSHAWLIVSDSGGIQEEAPSLGKPLLVLRENTERPEAIEAGVARLVGGSPSRLAEMLEHALDDQHWIQKVERVDNPFGVGDSGERIANIINAALSNKERRENLLDNPQSEGV